MIGWYKCEKCNYIHMGHDMLTPGYKCENCNTPSRGGTAFFNYNINILIDLMQDLYNAEQINDDFSLEKKQISVIIFYTTIGEMLMDQLLSNLINKNCKNKNLQNKLINDSQSFNKKLELFKLLTVEKFDDSVKSFNNNFLQIIEFYREVRDARNEFLHNGKSYLIEDEMPKQCLDNVMGLVILFVELNNKYNLIDINNE